ncbi:MAG TPA: hypothetical protein VGM88_27995 [Kofleriaceae bacterium]|jgi:hypothetical protein
MATKRVQQIENQARAALETATMWFPELEDAEITISFEARPQPQVTATHRRLAMILPTDTIGRVDRLMERTVYQACALHMWRRECENRDHWAALEAVHGDPVAAVLATAFNELDEFGLRVVLYETQAREGCLEVFTPREDIGEFDRVANLVAMRFVEFESTFGEAANSDAVETCLARYADSVHGLFAKYAEVRPTIRASLCEGGDRLTATMGLETLSGHEDFSFLDILWDRNPATNVPTKIKIDVDESDLWWPPPDDEDEDGSEAEDDEEDDDEPYVETWRDLDQALQTEQETLRDVMEEVATLESIEDVPDAHRDSWAECGHPGPLSVGSAATAVLVIGGRISQVDDGSDFGYPDVIFWCPPSYLTLLKRCAEAAKVGLVDAQSGAVEVYAMADDVFGLLRFAEQVRSLSSEFDALKANIEPT